MKRNFINTSEGPSAILRNNQTNALYMITLLYSHYTLLHVSGRTDTFCEHGQQNCVHTRGAGKFLDRPTSRYISFDGKNISFADSLVIYIYIYIYIYIVLIFLQL